MRKVQAQGSYSIPKEFDNAGAEVTFDFEYEIFDEGDIKIELISSSARDVYKTPAHALATLNQTRKEDCRNNANGSAKSKNGHSTRIALTPKEKERRSAEAKATREMIKLAKSKGLTLQDLMAMIK